MRIETIRVSNKFKKQYKKLPKNIKEKAKEKENIFRNEPFNAILDTHKLHGEEKNIWAFSINHSYRIKFIFLENKEVLFFDCSPGILAGSEKFVFCF